MFQLRTVKYCVATLFKISHIRELYVDPLLIKTDDWNFFASSCLDSPEKRN